jgi:hypothetical protein
VLQNGLQQRLAEQRGPTVASMVSADFVVSGEGVCYVFVLLIRHARLF